MDAARALADLKEFSSQVEGAVLAEAGGKVLASTFVDEGKAESVARAALRLLEAADETRRDAVGEALMQLQAATPAGSVFLVRDAGYVVAAVTAPDPTVGLIFYDLKTCLRLVDREEKPVGGGSKENRGETNEEPGRATSVAPAGKDADA